jgi:catechol 2,3-dioxygenase-like lactoylglutathione lyase family enzyme
MQGKLIGFVMTAQPDAALAFYRDRLGLRFVSDDGFALVFESGGNMIRIAKVAQHTPLQGTVLGWEVADIDASVSALEEAGVALNRYPGLPQDARGICSFPGGDKVAWFTDPDGNVLSLSQHGAAK